MRNSDSSSPTGVSKDVASSTTSTQRGLVLKTVLAWCRLPALLSRFVFGGPPLRTIETVTATPEWVRHVTVIRMTAYRDVLRGWAYRERFARVVRTVNRLMPDWIAYRLLIRARCAAELAAAARRNVSRYGERLRQEAGLPLAYQIADILTVCLKHPGTFPSEYYAFRLHEPAHRGLAAEGSNPYHVEMVNMLVHPPADPHGAGGFASRDLEALNDKERFRALCEKEGVRHASSLAVFSGGSAKWTGPPGLPSHDLFLKPLHGGEGRGAARVFYDAATETYRIDRPVSLLTGSPYPAAPMSAAALTDWLQEIGRNLPMLLQTRLRAHADLVRIVGDATLPTARVVTVRHRSGSCGVLYAYFRFAMTDVSVDNGAAGGGAAMIDRVTHQLGEAATLFDGRIQVHPLTGRPFKGCTVPHVDAACELTIRLHQALATLQDVPVPVIGWDVAILDEGPILTEGNPLSAIAMPQKLLNRGGWSEGMFRDGVLSYLAPLAGRRISLDPGA